MLIIDFRSTVITMMLGALEKVSEYNCRETEKYIIYIFNPLCIFLLYYATMYLIPYSDILSYLIAAAEKGIKRYMFTKCRIFLKVLHCYIFMQSRVFRVL